MNDNVYANSGESFKPTETEKIVNKELQDTLNQVPLLKEIIEDVKQKAGAMMSVDSIAVTPQDDPELFMREVIIRRTIRGELLNIARTIEARVEATMKQ